VEVVSIHRRQRLIRDPYVNTALEATIPTLLALKKAGDPMPACATPISPWVDLEGLGDSMTSRDEIDPMVHKPMILQMAQTYLGGKSARDPLAAPLYVDLAGLPPLLIHVGQRETLYDDAKRMADKAKQAGVPVELDEVEGEIHVWHIFASRLDEGEQAIQKIGAFIRRHTA
jgi:epsilon-lactone hydrolase